MRFPVLLVVLVTGGFLLLSTSAAAFSVVASDPEDICNGSYFDTRPLVPLVWIETTDNTVNQFTPQSPTGGDSGDWDGTVTFAGLCSIIKDIIDRIIHCRLLGDSFDVASAMCVRSQELGQILDLALLPQPPVDGVIFQS